LVLFGQAADAQDSRASPPLPSLPQVYETADVKIRVEKLADGLSNPWSLAWLPNGDLLITERVGRLRVFSNGELVPEPIAGVPEVRRTVLGGLLEVLPHPSFATNRILYLTYAKGGEGNLATTALARARLRGHALENVE
jgi:glucose/arabinose dehydrogenase